MHLCCDVLNRLAGKTLATAESCTGGGIGALLTAIPGSSTVYKGGIISYCNDVKAKVLKVSQEDLERYGAVSAPVALQMAMGGRRALQADVCVSVTGLAGPDGDDFGNLLNTDIAVSVTGLAGPDGDEFGHPVGTVFIGYDSVEYSIVRKYVFTGDREAVRHQAIRVALQIILEYNECMKKPSR